MTNNNENEATGTDELSAEVAHKIGVEMGHFRLKRIVMNRQRLLVLEEYITQLEHEVRFFGDIDTTQIYRLAEDLVLNKAMKEATQRVMNQ